jgi:hypothetical protein
MTFNSLIRLQEFEINAIKAIFSDKFSPGDHLWIFGSRVNLGKRGGDIDLYIETTIDTSLLFKIKLDFIIAICDKIGDQKIDVVINTINNSLNLPIYSHAIQTGVQLV